MKSFSVRVRSVGLLTVGWSHPIALGPDIPFARKLVGNRSVLYIPGSSFKGALRSSASRVAKAYGFESCGQTLPKLIYENHGSGKPCDVCNVFGWPGGGQARVFFSDLECVQGSETFTTTRIRLTDNTLTVAERALFVAEHLPYHAEFKGNVSYWDIDGERLALLLLAMAELRLGRIGRTSAVDVKIEETGDLAKDLPPTWGGLLSELGAWLWP
jgi:CRISPR/Cas system CSM-associated protein Csm3 (group 7 of RAMP superfamily)